MNKFSLKITVLFLSLSTFSMTAAFANSCVVSFWGAVENWPDQRLSFLIPVGFFEFKSLHTVKLLERPTSWEECFVQTIDYAKNFPAVSSEGHPIYFSWSFYTGLELIAENNGLVTQFTPKAPALSGSQLYSADLRRFDHF